MKKTIQTIFIVIVYVCIVTVTTHAASLQLQGAPASVAGREQFYVDVAVDPQGGDFNGVEGDVSFSSDKLQLVRIETGSTVISSFIDQPALRSDTIHFSGIIIGGFKGLINPFDQSHTLPGEIMRLVFAGAQPGNAVIKGSNFSITLNDGDGTLQQLPDATAAVTVTDAVAPSVYAISDDIPPTITASVVSEKELFDGKYALIYNAIDKQSGIDRVELREGRGAWKVIQSPYELQDQSRHAILSLRAYDVAGNMSAITVPAATSSVSVTAIIFLALIALIILYVIHKKSKHPHHLRRDR